VERLVAAEPLDLLDEERGRAPGPSRPSRPRLPGSARRPATARGPARFSVEPCESAASRAATRSGTRRSPAWSWYAPGRRRRSACFDERPPLVDLRGRPQSDRSWSLEQHEPRPPRRRAAALRAVVQQHQREKSEHLGPRPASASPASGRAGSPPPRDSRRKPRVALVEDQIDGPRSTPRQALRQAGWSGGTREWKSRPRGSFRFARTKPLRHRSARSSGNATERSRPVARAAEACAASVPPVRRGREGRGWQQVKISATRSFGDRALVHVHVVLLGRRTESRGPRSSSRRRPRSRRQAVRSRDFRAVVTIQASGLAGNAVARPAFDCDCETRPGRRSSAMSKVPGRSPIQDRGLRDPTPPGRRPRPSRAPVRRAASPRSSRFLADGILGGETRVASSIESTSIR